MLYGGNIAESWSIFGAADVFESLTRREIEAVRVLGGNAVRVMGHPAAVLDGTISLPTYLYCWEQIIEYCAAVGMTVYPCGYSGHLRASKTLAELLTVLEPWAEHVTSLCSNLYGIDICNEPTINGGASVAEAVQLYAAITARTGLKVTFSDYQTPLGPAPWSLAPAFAPYVAAGVCDFFDFHVYSDSTLDRTALNKLAVDFPTKRFMLGEFGAPASLTDQQRATRVKNALAIAQHERCDGALLWSLFNYDSVPWNQYGIFRGPGKPPHPAMAAAFELGIAPRLFLHWFNGPAGTLLQNCVPNIGLGWSASGLGLDGAGNIAAGTGFPQALTAAPLPANAPVNIEFTHTGAAAGHYLGAYLRRQANGDAYLVRVRSEGGTAVRWEVYKYLNNAWVLPYPASIPGTLPLGKSYQLTASVVGGVITLQCSEVGLPLVTRAQWVDPAPLPAGAVLLAHVHTGGLPLTEFSIMAA